MLPVMSAVADLIGRQPLNLSALRTLRGNALGFSQRASSIATAARIRLLAFGSLVAEGMAETYEEIFALRLALLDRGWYLSPDVRFGTVLQLLANQRSVDPAALDRAMAEITRTRVLAIATAAAEGWAHRGELIAEASEAHAAGRYGSSVLLVLSQADGIAQEMFGQGLFATEFAGGERRPRVAKAMDRVLDEIRSRLGEAMLQEYFGYFLQHVSALHLRQPELQAGRSGMFGPLNRHAAIHGDDVDFATEQNSLRAFSLLDYLVNFRRLDGQPMFQPGLALGLTLFGAISTAREMGSMQTSRLHQEPSS